MKKPEDAGIYAAEQGTTEQGARKIGMEPKSETFLREKAKVYSEIKL